MIHSTLASWMNRISICGRKRNRWMDGWMDGYMDGCIGWFTSIEQRKQTLKYISILLSKQNI